jgi:Lipid A 3-O-deacylase (PagL)
MKTHTLRLGRLVVVLAGVFTGLPLLADGNEADPSYFVLGSGASYVLSSTKFSLISAEYRFEENFYGVRPYLLGCSRSNGDNYYVGSGLLYNFDLSPQWRITISSGPGYYDHDRGSFNLGKSIEFYSNFEVSTRVWHGHWLGLSLGHISNGGLANHNPGAETLRLVYAIPLR